MHYIVGQKFLLAMKEQEGHEHGSYLIENGLSKLKEQDQQ